MTSDQSANRTTGETEGVDQNPTHVGESDTTQQKQAANEHREAGASIGQQPDENTAEVRDQLPKDAERVAVSDNSATNARDERNSGPR